MTGCFLGRSDLAWLSIVTVMGRVVGSGLRPGVQMRGPGYGGGGVLLTPSLSGLAGCEVGGVGGRNILGTT